MRRKIILMIVTLPLFIACPKADKSEIREDFEKYYEPYNVAGAFVLYNQKANKYTFYNSGWFNQPFTPASTFKICNSMIGLETGVIANQHYVIPWDGVKRNPIWDQDHDLELAYQNSTLWYYQELARRVGSDKMKEWVNKANYGNEDTSGGIEKFWFEGGLRISPKQQIDFLRRLHDNKLPFSKRTVRIVKEIMIETDTTGYTIRSKTGWGGQSGKDIGWYVGYMETSDNVYYFANVIQIDSKEIEQLEQAIKFDKGRTEIAKKIFTDINILKNNIPAHD